MAELIRTVHYYSEGSCAAVVRLPTHGHEWIAWALDAGAAGIILPHSETADEARHAVKSARFGPKGKRSFPPFALLPGHNDGTPEGKTMFDVWNDNAVIIMQIESALGVKNAHEIAAVEGVDALMIGPADLRFDMGLVRSFYPPLPLSRSPTSSYSPALTATSPSSSPHLTLSRTRARRTTSRSPASRSRRWSRSVSSRDGRSS